jgi:hypothetical protein
MACFNRVLSFGELKTNVDLLFPWYDSFDKSKKASRDVALEQFSALYNFGVSSARIGTLHDLSSEQGIKDASKLLQEAASIFDNLKTQANTLKPADISPDFQSQTCDMNSNLCLAQAQYLFYKMAKDKNMKPALLSQIAMQASVYFSVAFEKSQMAQPLRSYDNGAFAAKCGWFTNYFEAVAYWELGQVSYKEADDKGRGMGACCGYLNKAM